MDTLSFERVWEDTDFFEIKIKAQSAFICASAKSYTTDDSINELSSNVSSFAQNNNERYIWENGSKGDESTPFVSLEFWCEDRLGHVAIEVYMEIDDGAAYSKHNCCFYIKIEVGIINDFGKALIQLNKKGIGQKVLLPNY